MFRRSVLTVLLAVALLAGLVGVPMSLQFGPAPAFAATELHFLSVARGEPRRQAVLAAVADFEKANPGVKVVLSEIPFDQYFQKAAIALSSGSGNDVFDVDSPLVASYGHQGALLALDKYFTKENLYDITPAERDITQIKVRKEVGCNPCHEYSCRELSCIKAISADEVFKAAKSLLRLPC